MTKIDFQHNVSNVPEQVKFARIFFLLMHEKTKSTHQRFLKSLSHQTESLISLGTSWAFSTFSLLYWFKPFKGLLIFHRTPLLLCHDCPIHQWYWSWNCFSLLSYYSIVNGCPFVFLKAFCSARHLSIVFENHIKRSHVWIFAPKMTLWPFEVFEVIEVPEPIDAIEAIWGYKEFWVKMRLFR